MDTRYYMIIIKGEIKTSEVRACVYNKVSCSWDVTFNNGYMYSYSYSNIEKLTKPTVLAPNMYSIKRNGYKLFDIKSIYVFKSSSKEYWHICFDNGSERTYLQSELDITKSCLCGSHEAKVFEYIKKLAELSEIKDEYSGEELLPKKFEKICVIGDDIALAKYLNPSLMKADKISHEYIPIFPFGCNNSQYKAVKNAMENQFSIIQGPPGTGKTQTILNIIANVLLQGKTVQVVSNNNAATENVYEKLSSVKYNLGFVAAKLGNFDNKKEFIKQQSGAYPDFSSWKIPEEGEAVREKIKKLAEKIKIFFDKQEELAYLKQELSQLDTERKYFKQYVEESGNFNYGIRLNKKLSSRYFMELWKYFKLLAQRGRAVGFWHKIKIFLKYRITDWSFYKQDISDIIKNFQNMYYDEKQAELLKEISDIESYLNSADKNLLDNLCNESMRILKDKLARKYEKNESRKIFDEENLWKKAQEVLEEYPLVLSTTFSSRNSLHRDIVYDYLIMDEASQVDIVTGALSLSCAKNVVIVGDTKQLQNVVKTEVEKKSNDIFNNFNVGEGYRYTKSFLQSVLDVMPNISQTLLREHYRCHPKIINFCNQKFYKGELIIMTSDKGEENVLTAVKTVKGNHERNHYSQRQIDVIKDEVMDKCILDPDETGIITPYTNQVRALNREISAADSSTVHKFQGREKDNIIISTVDDEISDFADNPYLVNVAVSRAKKRLVVVVSGNEQKKERNISDLIDYIQYNNFELIDSKIYSIFDYLYKQYTEERIKYLNRHKKISKFDSENLMYSLLEEIIADEKYSNMDIICYYPLNMLIKNTEVLNEREKQYAMNPATHLDFLIYNKITKKHILAIEVDGYEYHKEGSAQASLDLLKNHIMELYEIPLLRFMTNGSREKEKIKSRLDEILLS